MRKSLGSKRKELGEADIDRITQDLRRLLRERALQIFDGRDFGYSTITVERPLRLSFTITEERLALLKENKALAKLPEYDRIIAGLRSLPADTEMAVAHRVYLRCDDGVR